MADKYVDLPLFNSPDYKFSIALEGSYYTIRITYNETMQLSTMQIKDVDGNMLIAGVGLVPNYPICLDYVLEGLTGTFLLIPISDKNIEFYKLYPTRLKDYYTLSYLYDDASQ